MCLRAVIRTRSGWASYRRYFCELQNCTYEKNYHPAIYDTDLYHYGSDKIGCKTILKRTNHYMWCPYLVLLLLHPFQKILCMFIFMLWWMIADTKETQTRQWIQIRAVIWCSAVMPTGSKIPQVLDSCKECEQFISECLCSRVHQLQGVSLSCSSPCHTHSRGTEKVLCGDLLIFFWLS